MTFSNQSFVLSEENVHPGPSDFTCAGTAEVAVIIAIDLIKQLIRVHAQPDIFTFLSQGTLGFKKSNYS